VAVVYYAFTTLSTVGFGDYNPRSDLERVTCAFILIFGVAIFSYMMGIFIEILGKYQDLNAELDEGDSLSRFFGMIKNFNNGVDIDKELRDRIESYFEYRWDKDLNQAVNDEEEEKLLQQLPNDVQDSIFSVFLFGKFL